MICIFDFDDQPPDHFVGLANRSLPLRNPAPMEIAADSLESRKTAARDWFEGLAVRIIAAFEALEGEADPTLYKGDAGAFVRTPWRRVLSADGQDQGGGVMGMMRGRLFEKVGVHVS